MRTLRTVAELRAALAGPRRDGAVIGLVPTMGALHDGHLSLLRRARADCDVVVVSLFVNPAQFNESADLARYPRDERRDAALAAARGADILFAPGVEDVYPDGFATQVGVSGVSERLEGVERGPGHFTAVATVVAKLLGMAGPDVAYFGQKDFQQTLVVKRMVADLNLPVRIEVCPTVREADGLALSSRNVHLSAEDRRRATAIPRALGALATAAQDGESDPTVLGARALAVLAEAGIDPEYLTIADAGDLWPLERIDRPAIALLAARVGATRLIDNVLLDPAPAPTRSGAGRTTTMEVSP